MGGRRNYQPSGRETRKLVDSQFSQEESGFHHTHLILRSKQVSSAKVEYVGNEGGGGEGGYDNRFFAENHHSDMSERKEQRNLMEYGGKKRGKEVEENISIREGGGIHLVV